LGIEENAPADPKAGESAVRGHLENLALGKREEFAAEVGDGPKTLRQITLHFSIPAAKHRYRHVEGRIKGGIVLRQ
jgi:hypothetical protein